MLRLPGSALRKTSPERMLLAARTKLTTVLDSMDTTAPLRSQIVEAEEILLAAETKLREAKHSKHSVTLKPVEDEEESDRSPDAKAKFIRSQLSRVFTDCDIDVAGTNFSTKSKNRAQPSIRRSTTDELDLRLTKIITNEEAMSCLEHTATLDFDALEFASLPVVGDLPVFVSFAWVEQKRHILSDIAGEEMISDARDFKRCLFHFLEIVDKTYQRNAYHNGAHGADTLMTFDWFFHFDFLSNQTTCLDHLMGLLAAAIHDVGHPGRNNNFQIKTMTELAVRYNDKSVLENMHVSRAFEIIKSQRECNWLSLLRKDFNAGDLQGYVRKGLIEMVLATDPAKHGRQVKELQQIFEEDDCGEDENSHQVEALEKKLFILGTLLHASDVANPVRPRAIMLQWTQALLMEFWSQGDEERSLGQPVSPLCDRETEMLEVPKGQLGFINFVIEPLYSTIVLLIPQSQEAVDNLKKNKEFWQQKKLEMATFSQIF